MRGDCQVWRHPKLHWMACPDFQGGVKLPRFQVTFGDLMNTKKHLKFPAESINNYEFMNKYDYIQHDLTNPKTMAHIWQTRSFPTEFHVHYICVPTAPSFNEGPSLGQGPLRPVLGAREFRASLPRHQGGAATADGLRPGNLLKTDTRLGIWENTPDITGHHRTFLILFFWHKLPNDT